MLGGIQELSNFLQKSAHSVVGSSARRCRRNIVEYGIKMRALERQARRPTIWVSIGSRPLMVRNNRHDTAYLFGAIWMLQ